MNHKNRLHNRILGIGHNAGLQQSCQQLLEQHHHEAKTDETLAKKRPQTSELNLHMPTFYPTVRSGTVVRPMSPVGSYWRSSLLTEYASFVVRDDLIFTACHFDKDAHEGDYYTEYDDLTPEEVRLLGAMQVSTGLHRGFMAQYPETASLRLETKQSLDDKDVLAEVEAQLRDALAKSVMQPLSATPLPPSRYTHFHWPNPSKVQERLFAAINPFDTLMIRGLATLLKAGMLHMHLAF
ncbi:hypothetical protein GRI72_14460 [Altererythrobacter marinus]|uniref:Uncharacterized protein n=1 Tax=Pelagerythrobacter marinus TaxID=538382 RepID=A0ABW9V1I5_9SPHN|nr:hypothetical protein [Pelagerythrobacter marinus]MXO70004.1 hypothetical protein [Pelagerythrobacter marinus]